MRLQDKVVIITGSTAGIGRTSAELFAAEGAKVVVSGRRADKGEAVVEQIKQAGGDAFFVQTDVLKEEDLDRLVAATVEHYGRIDVLFANAGIANTAAMEDMPQEEWDNILNMNVRSTYLMVKKTMPYLIESKGNVLFTSSISGVKGVTGGYAYNPSKHAINGLMKVIAIDYADKGVRANCICPGLTMTDILSVVSDELLAIQSAKIPLKRIGDPKEIANAALFLVSDEASFITGQALVVDGGMTM